ncbi:uncharacterized protein PHACADRAFT_30880 [Phanerochaete carnosa HHB-10118-sp]|uniref:Fatty acid desaturase domain-containing protein n=1 Tax=Phanerochaete carnosa (strain HHB-10118-sp) TaxID=650164 RepID=K5WPV3_PHACS|nr:uncharacterized protein PHACADRAFT_30880 [Phanerochaete carnosa HHB-10118-sp]EKM52352.1 hypothetical protein PHACADRAFT_30880 [Phanerochaete carnosa HHB-10118-sp]
MTEGSFTESEPKMEPFVPPELSMDEIRSAIPKRLFKRHTLRGVLYVIRDFTMAVALWYGARHIDDLTRPLGGVSTLALMLVVPKLGSHRDVGHRPRGMLSAQGHTLLDGSPKRISVFTGLSLRRSGWRITHHQHHVYHGSMERDMVYVPWTRSELNVPEDKEGTLDYEDYLGDTPLYAFLMLMRQQFLGFPAYFLFNASGKRSYPKGSTHYNPYAVMFLDSQRRAVILSNIGTLSMILLVYFACRTWGTAAVAMYYGIPWLFVNHWVGMVTYLQHTDTALPHYRASAWMYTQGAASTINRDFLRWMGKFFLHGASYYHVAHYFFPKMPFYHLEEATVHLKAVLGDQYYSLTKPVFKALWDTYNNCQFVENTGKDLSDYPMGYEPSVQFATDTNIRDIVFFHNRKGQPVRELAAGTDKIKI